MRLYFILIIFFLISCGSNSSDKSISIEKLTKPSTTNLALPKDSLTEISVLEIKLKYQLYSTSTILSKKESQKFCKPDSVGFYGFYNLIDSIPDYVGYLTVFNNGTPKNWQYDNDNDLLISLDYQNGDMIFFNGIRIGMNESALINHLKNQVYYENDTLIHADIAKYSVDFYLVNDIISRIMINYKCK